MSNKNLDDVVDEIEKETGVLPSHDEESPAPAQYSYPPPQPQTSPSVGLPVPLTARPREAGGLTRRQPRPENGSGKPPPPPPLPPQAEEQSPQTAGEGGRGSARPGVLLWIGFLACALSFAVNAYIMFSATYPNPVCAGMYGVHVCLFAGPWAEGNRFAHAGDITEMRDEIGRSLHALSKSQQHLEFAISAAVDTAVARALQLQNAEREEGGVEVGKQEPAVVRSSWGDRIKPVN